MHVLTCVHILLLLLVEFPNIIPLLVNSYYYFVCTIVISAREELASFGHVYMYIYRYIDTI